LIAMLRIVLVFTPGECASQIVKARPVPRSSS